MPTINGTNTGDTLYGTDAADTINGLGGNDQLKGFGGADRLDGGTGIDTAFYSDSTVGVTVNLTQGRGFGGSAEGDTLFNIENLFGSSYNDQLTGNAYDNALNGLGGSDILKGGGGDDTLDGGSGDDTLKGGGGADTLIGGPGNDTADFSDDTAGYTVSLVTGLAIRNFSPNNQPEDHLSSIENITGSAYFDNLTGNAGANVLRGGDGDDILDGGGGADIMYGGAGNDRFYVDNPDDVFWENAGEGTNDFVLSSVSYALQAGSEIEVLAVTTVYSTAAITFVGNEFRNTLAGNWGDNILDGGAGADQMFGYLGNDLYVVDNSADRAYDPVNNGTFDRVLTSVTFTLEAGSEIEVLAAINGAATTAFDLVGNEFANTILGNDGQNTIVGGLGIDTLTGNGGGDVFVWTSTAESRLAGDEADVITDFNRPQGDLIAVNSIDADDTVAGDQAFTFIGTAAFTAAGQINYFTTATDTYILLNTDGDASQEMTTRLAGVHNVDASWFVL